MIRSPQYTERTRKVLKLARDETLRLNHDYIGTEHLLLGLIKEKGGVGYEILQNLNIDTEKVKLEIEKLVQRGPSSMVSANPTFTPKAEGIINNSAVFSKEFGHNYIGTEHLLYALASKEDTVAYCVLKSFNINSTKIKEEMQRILSPEKSGMKEPERKAEMTSYETFCQNLQDICNYAGSFIKGKKHAKEGELEKSFYELAKLETDFIRNYHNFTGEEKEDVYRLCDLVRKTINDIHSCKFLEQVAKPLKKRKRK